MRNESSQVWELTRFYLNDSLQGMLSRPFFAKKSNRVIMGTLILVAYAAYIAANAKESNTLLQGSAKAASIVLERAQRTTLSSFLSVGAIFTAVIYVFVGTTASLTSRAVFLTKALPYSPKAVSRSIGRCRFLMALGVYELALMPIVPSMPLISNRKWAIACVFVMMQACFVLWYCVYDIVFHAITDRWNRKLVDYATYAILMIAAVAYFVWGRFIIDGWVSSMTTPVDVLLVEFTVLFAILATGAVLVRSVMPLEERCHMVKSFRSVAIVRTPRCIRILWPVHAVLRTGFAAVTLILACVLAFSSWLSGYRQGGFSDAFSILGGDLTVILPLTGVVFLPYADSTGSMRPLHRKAGISMVSECSLVLMTVVVWSLPALALSLSLFHKPTTGLYSLCVCLAALIVGFLFPRSAAAGNETLSGVGLVFIIGILTAMLRVEWMLVPASIVLLVAFIVIIKKELA